MDDSLEALVLIAFKPNSDPELRIKTTSGTNSSLLGLADVTSFFSRSLSLEPGL